MMRMYANARIPFAGAAVVCVSIGNWFLSSYYDGDGDDDYVELPMTVTDVLGSKMFESLPPF